MDGKSSIGQRLLFYVLNENTGSEEPVIHDIITGKHTSHTKEER